VIAAAPEVSDNLKTLTDEILEKILDLETRSGQKVQNLWSQPVADADLERDEFHQNIVKYVRGAKFHPDKLVADAAKSIYSLLELHHTDLAREAYSVESHNLNALLLDFEKPQYIAEATTFGLSGSVTQLREAQKKFEFVHLTKNKNETELTIEQIAAYVVPIREILLELLSALKTQLRRNPEQYTPVVNQVNGLINEAVSKARARQTRKKTESQNANALKATAIPA
jgi:hypothetical protein